MRYLLIGVVLSSVLASAVAKEAFPPEVQRFIERREGCDHFRGEEAAPGDRQRRKEIERGLRKLCPGTDLELARLKKKYKEQPDIMRRLDDFEARIE